MKPIIDSQSRHYATRLCLANLLIATTVGAQSYPPIPGAYRPSNQSPRVFTTEPELRDFAARIRHPNSFSARMYAKLSRQERADITANVDYDSTYSGCDIDFYLHGFSFESRGGYAKEERSEKQMSQAMHVRSGFEAPAGAAIVAARLALYAALRNAGAPELPGAPTPDSASALSKRILLAWAEHGFRDNKHQFLIRPQQFCEAGHSDPILQTTVGLQIARGVIYSVHAQDLLASLHALSPEETHTLNTFHLAMYDLIRHSSNFAAEPEFRQPDRICEIYSNHRGAHLLGLIAIARLVNDPRRLNAALYGDNKSVAIGWTQYFDHALYGEHDHPIACYKNTGRDSLTSAPSFQTGGVAPGEGEDRYRHANPDQAMGYSMFTLLNLNFSALVLRNAGFDALAYRGRHHQSIELSTAYYACYARTVGFGKPVTAENARACPDFQEYIGQNVNEVEKNILLGASNLPRDAAITSVEAAAKARPDGQPLDPILFGHWRD